MNKDAILASVIGFGIGLIITGAILAGPNLIGKFNAMRKQSGSVASATTQTTPTVSPTGIPNNSSITIETPTSESIVTSQKLTVTGKAPQGAFVLVGGLLDETVVQATQGAYTATITLKEGKNDITVSSVGDTTGINHVTVYESEQ